MQTSKIKKAYRFTRDGKQKVGFVTVKFPESPVVVSQGEVEQVIGCGLPKTLMVFNGSTLHWDWYRKGDEVTNTRTGEVTVIDQDRKIPKLGIGIEPTEMLVNVLMQYGTPQGQSDTTPAPVSSVTEVVDEDELSAIDEDGV